MPLFHSCPLPLADGSVILPGNWGRNVRKMGYRHHFFIREMVFENVRLTSRPEAPSRLNCTYALATEADARQYYEREQKSLEYLYEVETVGITPLFAAPLNVFGAVPQGFDAAGFYWINGRQYNGSPTSLPPLIDGMPIWWELLIGGAIRIVRMLD